MKQLDDYTGEELLAMTDEQRERLITTEVVLQGVAIVEQPKKPEYLDMPEKTVPAWELFGYYFTNEEAAQRVLAALHNESQYITTSDWNYRVGSEFKYLKPRTSCSATIDKEMFYREEEVEEYCGVMKENARRKQEYDTRMSEYNAYVRARGDIESDMYAKMDEARSARLKVERTLEMWNTYLDIAEGNVVQAFRFITKTGKVEAGALLELMADSGLHEEAEAVRTQRESGGWYGRCERS